MKTMLVAAVSWWLWSSSSAAVAAPRVAYVGDSIAFETSPVVHWVVASSGATYGASTLGGMAICDFLPETQSTYRKLQNPVPPDLSQLVRTLRPDVVVLQFWGNSWQYTPCMRDAQGVVLAPGTAAYYDRYAADAQRAMVVIRDAAAAVGAPMPQVRWVLQGPDRGNPSRTRTLDARYRAVAAAWPTAGVIDAGRTVSLAANYWNPGDRYGWSQWLPCTPLERDGGHCNPAYGGVAQIHAADDSLHFCLGDTDAAGLCSLWSPGVFRYGLAIADAVLALID